MKSSLDFSIENGESNVVESIIDEKSKKIWIISLLNLEILQSQHDQSL